MLNTPTQDSFEQIKNLKKGFQMNFIKSISLIVITVLFSFCAIAGNDPVNCKDVKIGELKLYSEWASCEVGGYYLEQYFFPTTQRVHQLTKFIYGGNYVQCDAPLTYYEIGDITKEVCEYTPTASIKTFVYEADTQTKVWVEGGDSDGTISKEELWVNGSKQQGNSATLTGNVGDTFNVVGKVTDNDGNTDSTSRTIKLVYRPVEMCGQYPC